MDVIRQSGESESSRILPYPKKITIGAHRHELQVLPERACEIAIVLVAAVEAHRLAEKSCADSDFNPVFHEKALYPAPSKSEGSRYFGQIIPVGCSFTEADSASQRHVSKDYS